MCTEKWEVESFVNHFSWNMIFQPLTIFGKSPILEVWKGSEYISEVLSDLSAEQFLWLILAKMG